jgi:hypothetical protein
VEYIEAVKEVKELATMKLSSHLRGMNISIYLNNENSQPKKNQKKKKKKNISGFVFKKSQELM